MWANLAIVLAIAGAAWYAYSWAYDRGAESVQVKWGPVEKERAINRVLTITDAGIAVGIVSLA